MRKRCKAAVTRRGGNMVAIEKTRGDGPALGWVDPHRSKPRLHLELRGASVADCRVSTFSIVEAFDVIEHVSLGFVTHPIRLACCAGGFGRREEALHRGIVPNVARAAQRADDAVTGPQLREMPAGELTSLQW